jgi:hypothetical protein
VDVAARSEDYADPAGARRAQGRDVSVGDREIGTEKGAVKIEGDEIYWHGNFIARKTGQYLDRLSWEISRA